MTDGEVCRVAQRPHTQGTKGRLQKLPDNNWLLKSEFPVNPDLLFHGDDVRYGQFFRENDGGIINLYQL